MSVFVKVAGAWKTVSRMYVRVSGAWKPVVEAYVKVGGVWKSLKGPAVLLDRTQGTNIGDMTAAGGIAAAFDGVTSQDRSVCARKGSTANQNGFVGKTFPTPTAIQSFTVMGSNGHGFVDTNPNTTLTIYGKNGAAPASGTDGTPLGSITFVDTNNESAGRLITSTDQVSYWDHAWVHLTQTDNQGISIAEVQMTGWQ